MDVGRDDHVIDEHGIDADAHHDEKTLERQCEQALEVVRADAAPFAVAHRRYGDRRDAHGAINLNHTAIEDDRDEDGHYLEAQTDQQRLYGQTEQFPNAHRFHAGSHLFEGGFDVDVRVAAYDSGCTGYDILTDVEDRHHNVKGIGNEINRHSRLEKPLEEHPCVHIMQVVFLSDHGNQLVTQDKGDDDTSDGDYHIFG